ncbi:hypothetical protein NM688_g6898 [Phlebia brevispora]|uniref:Uncharacterized protein n=1 Tax=Phlebia brevispora TaxID=194682 RepID=A0ACC1SBF7_9APHY|nr:hypothetical protein NM688_g6898 [Phlebia brevispora]
MSKVDSTVSLGPEESAEVLDVFNDIANDLHPSSPKLANALFGTARQRSISKLKSPSRRDSPTLPWRTNSQRSMRETILANTPKPRRSSSTFLSSPTRNPSTHSLDKSPKFDDNEDIIDDRSFASVSDYGNLLDDIDSGPEDDDGSETDSSIDIHTPLPHLMFRDGLLSPRSKLLPQNSPGSFYSDHHDGHAPRAGSVMSLASTAGSVVTKSGLQRDPRDTARRRVRHRDRKLLCAGMGLTTGLGWSDSEDEDAPSALTRRLITTTIERNRSGSVTSPSHRTSQLGGPSLSRFSSPVPSSKSPLPRKSTSTSNLRSASVSFPVKSPSSPGIGPGSGLRVPRGRAASTATASISPPTSLFSSHTKSSLSLSQSTSSLRSQPIAESPSPTESTFSKALPSPPAIQTRTRTRVDSNASTATSSRSVSSITTPTAPFPRMKASTDSLKQGIQMPRARTDSVTVLKLGRPAPVAPPAGRAKEDTLTLLFPRRVPSFPKPIRRPRRHTKRTTT